MHSLLSYGVVIRCINMIELHCSLLDFLFCTSRHGLASKPAELESSNGSYLLETGKKKICSSDFSSGEEKGLLSDIRKLLRLSSNCCKAGVRSLLYPHHTARLAHYFVCAWCGGWRGEELTIN